LGSADVLAVGYRHRTQFNRAMRFGLTWWIKD